MKAYLVENYSPAISFDKNSLIVALSPEACYRLDKAGVRYSTIEDYYDESKLLANMDEYSESQLRWIDELDTFLQCNIRELKELDLKLATTYLFRLKTFVLDPLYVRCYTLRKLFEKIKPSEVTFISYQPGDISIDYLLRDTSKSYYSQLIPIYCRERGIQLSSVFLEKKELEPVKASGNISGRLKRALAENEIAGNLYYSLYSLRQYLSKRPSPPQPSQKKLNIFILRRGYHIWPYLAIDALRRGHRVYGLSGDFIVKYSFLATRKCFRLQKDSSYLDSSAWEHAANRLESSGLIESINNQCQSDVSEVILPKLGHFISRICPDLLQYSQAFGAFYEREKINIVLAPSASSPIEYAALAAARLKSLNSVYLAHGDDAFTANAYLTVERQNFNIHILSNRELGEYCQRYCRTSNFQPGLYVSPHRLLPIEKIRRQRERRSNRTGQKGRVIYLPTMLRGDNQRLEGKNYSDTWYYQSQKALMEYFSTRTDYTFVWKGLPQSDAIYNPIPDFIQDSNFTNIEVATNPFVEHLLSADKVILDFPSTGFYESVVAGIPTISLYHKLFSVRKSAIDYFGKLLQPFSDIPEAIKRIDAFLNSDPELYQTTIETGDESVIHILETIPDGRENQSVR